MKFFILSVALFATAFLAAEGRAAPTTRELIDLLEKIVKKELDGGAGNELDELHNGIHQLVQKNAADFADTPVFEVPLDVLGPLLKEVVNTMGSHIPAELGDIVGARFTQAFMTVLIYDGMDTVWGIAAHNLAIVSELSGEEKVDKKATIAKQTRRLAKREAPTEGEGLEYWDAVFDVLIAPNYAVLNDLYTMISEVDSDYYGNFFLDMYYMAEDEGLLSRNLDQCAIEIGENLAYAMYTPTANPVPNNLMPKVVGRVAQWVADVKALSVDSVKGIELKEEEKKALANVVQSIIPLLSSFIEPAENLLDLFQNNPDGITEFFLSVLFHTLEEQYTELQMVIGAVHDGAEMKADVIGRLIDNISNGKGKEVFAALFTKMAHHALATGYDLGEYMYWAGDLLDQLDADFNGPPPTTAGKKRIFKSHKAQNMRRFAGRSKWSADNF